MIVSSHILSEISELCDHVIILSEGHVVADDDMAELEARVSPDKTIRMTVKGDEEGIRAVLEGIDGVEEITTGGSSGIEGTVSLVVKTIAAEDLRDTIFFAMAEARYAVLSMEMAEQSLESIFLSLTGGTAADNSAADNSAADNSAADVAAETDTESQAKEEDI